MRILVIGGVAAGLSAASKAKRNNPSAEVIVYEKTQDISYGACGLPYFVSGLISEANDLVTISAKDFREKRGIDIRTGCLANSFDPRQRLVYLQNLATGVNFSDTYDKLIIATGARAIVPKLPGMELGNIFTIRTLQDGLRLKSAVQNGRVKNAAIIGGGYIGLELAETLSALNIPVTIVEQTDRLMKNVDPEISALILNYLENKGVRVLLNNFVKSIEGNKSIQAVHLQDGNKLGTDLLIPAMGIKPETEFARSGGVQTGHTGAIAVNDRMQTSLRDVYACGDCVEARHRVTGKMTYVPLGTTANKQGRIAGDNATDRPTRFGGIVGTAAIKIFDLEVARSGLTLNAAREHFPDAAAIEIKSGSRAGYYPGGKELMVRLIFSNTTGRLYGGQIAGEEGAARRIDVIAALLHDKKSVFDLSELDLGYAPPFAPVWDPLLVAANLAIKQVREKKEDRR